MPQGSGIGEATKLRNCTIIESVEFETRLTRHKLSPSSPPQYVHQPASIEAHPHHFPYPFVSREEEKSNKQNRRLTNV